MSSWVKEIFFKSKQENMAVLGVSLTPNSASWCVVEKKENIPRVVEYFILSQNFQTPAEALNALESGRKLPKYPVYITLGYEYYSMLLVDAPEVPDSELREAVGWKVKDLISQSLDDVVIDAFLLPDDAYRGRMKMSYVAVMDKKKIADLVRVCEKMDFDLAGIGINELSMSALSVLNENSDRGIAVLYLNESGGTINLIENGFLYFSRTIEISLSGNYGDDAGVSSEAVDALALDVQRSLDYYESQLGKVGVSELWLVSGSDKINQWCSLLQERLPINTKLLPFLDEIALDEKEYQESIGRLASAFGAVAGRFS